MSVEVTPLWRFVTMLSKSLFAAKPKDLGGTSRPLDSKQNMEREDCARLWVTVLVTFYSSEDTIIEATQKLEFTWGLQLRELESTSVMTDSKSWQASRHGPEVAPESLQPKLTRKYHNKEENKRGRATNWPAKAHFQ